MRDKCIRSGVAALAGAYVAAVGAATALACFLGILGAS